MAYRDLAKRRESIRLAVTKLYASRREQGLCIYCGSSHAPLGKTMCFDCRVRHSGYSRKAYAKAKARGGV